MPVSDAELVLGQYALHNTIGAGGFAKVKSATHLLTGDKVAIKIMDKRCLGDDLPRVKTEVAALKELCHQQICRLYHVIDTPDRILLVLEHCSGGELFDYIVRKDRLTESEARHFFRQILSSIAFVHNRGYAHRDLKPENLLLSDDLQLKLIDFGLCAKPEGGINFPLDTCCGSPAYAAPELISGDQYLGSEVDIWSLGILLYALLCGFLPFEDENIGIMYKKIQAGVFEEPKWLSSHSKDILRKMLNTNPKERITVQGLLAHPWVAGDYTQPIKWKTIYDENVIDSDCSRVMAEHYGLSVEELEQRLLKWDYDYATATYFLLLRRKRRGLNVTLKTSSRVSEKRVLGQIQNTPSSSLRPPRSRHPMNILDSPTIHGSLEKGLECIDDVDEAETQEVQTREVLEAALRKFADTFSKVGDGKLPPIDDPPSRPDRDQNTTDHRQERVELRNDDMDLEEEDSSINDSYHLAMKDQTYESIDLGGPSPSVTPLKTLKPKQQFPPVINHPPLSAASRNRRVPPFAESEDMIPDPATTKPSFLPEEEDHQQLGSKKGGAPKQRPPSDKAPLINPDSTPLIMGKTTTRKHYVNTEPPSGGQEDKENSPAVGGDKAVTHHRHLFGRTPPKPGTVPRRDTFALVADRRPQSLHETGSRDGQNRDSGSNETPLDTPMTPCGSQSRDQSDDRSWEDKENDSYDSPGRTPRSKTKQPRGTGRRPPNSGRKMFSSLERGLDRVLKAMTPRKRVGVVSGPRVAKTVVNVSTTSTSSPDLVLAELVRIFEEKGLSYDRKGWVIRGKSERLTLELEVVFVSQVQRIGVRRKRLTGDAFYYKKICEEILKLARL